MGKIADRGLDGMLTYVAGIHKREVRAWYVSLVLVRDFVFVLGGFRDSLGFLSGQCIDTYKSGADDTVMWFPLLSGVSARVC